MNRFSSPYWAYAFLTIILLHAAAIPARAGESSERPAKVEVQLDTSQAPNARAWGEQARQLILDWHPRICNLLAANDYVAPRQIELVIDPSYRGIAATTGTSIRVSTYWIEQHPEDIGLIVHELAHVIQGYRSPQPTWMTEGIADYVRWAIYEAKPLDWFPLDRREQGYRASYQVTAGFFLWLEGGHWPGAMNKLNKAMRDRTYDESLFREATGKPLDELWTEYVAARQAQAEDEAE